MSEYQYYEFLAIDEPLTAAQIKAVERYSTRAEVTPTRWVNEYNYSNFRGDERLFLSKYYDAMVYVANWGTHRFMFRVPKAVIDLSEAKRYCPGEPADVRVSGEHAIFDLDGQDEGGGDWEEGEGWMRRLVPLREELMEGDRRVLYLAWLMLVEAGEFGYEGEEDPDAMEPPVPPGLKKLTAAQKAFVEFVRIDENLVAVAAQASEDIAPSGKAACAPEDLSQRIASLPQAEKDAILTALCDGSDPNVGTKLRRRFQQEAASRRPNAARGGPARTVAELRRAAKDLEVRRRQTEARRREKAKAKQEAAEAAAKEKRLAVLARDPEKAWGDVERRVGEKLPQAYDEAVALLCDLRDLASRSGAGEAENFRKRIVALRAKYASRQSLHKKMNAKGLGGRG